MKGAIVFLLCLALLKCNDFELFNQMADLEIGRTILSTVQIELSAENPQTERIIEMLTQMAVDATNDLKDREDSLKLREAQCDQQVAQVDQTLVNAKGARAEDLRKLPLKQEQLNDKVKQLSQKEGAEQRYQAKIATIQENVRKQKEANQKKHEESQQLIEALKEAKQIISQLNANPAFLQKKDKVLDKINDHSKTLGKTQGYGNILTMLMEITQDLHDDKEQVGNVVSIINELIESIKNLERVDKESNSEMHQVQLDEITRLELNIATMESDLARLRAQKATIDQQILELQNDIGTKEDTIAVKSQEKQHWLQACTDDRQSFLAIKQTKNNELSIISECIEIFTTRFNDKVSSFIQRMHI